jgi:hypothetical protein
MKKEIRKKLEKLTDLSKPAPPNKNRKRVKKYRDSLAELPMYSPLRSQRP